MIYAYIRVSTDRQSIKNQRYEILKFIDNRKINIDKWIVEKISSSKNYKDRKLGKLLNEVKVNDILIITEILRLGRSLMDIMGFLNKCMNLNIKVYSVKENYELGNNINSKILAFAFGLSAEIEKKLISQRTKEALARKKSEGVKLGRPKGSLSKNTKLTGKEKEIKDLLDKKISMSAIGRIFGVHRLIVYNFIKSRNL